MVRAKNDAHPQRRRGRPAGKNRVPLSIEERRARNALYEKERRNEAAEAMAQLAESLRCDPNISNADLLATAVSKLQESPEDLGVLQETNARLESEIALLQARLGINEEDSDSGENSETMGVTDSSTEPESTASGDDSESIESSPANTVPLDEVEQSINIFNMDIENGDVLPQLEQMLAFLTENEVDVFNEFIGSDS